MHSEAPAPRFIVCGDDNLTYRLVNELVGIHGADVTVIVGMTDSHDQDGLPIAAIDGVRVVRTARLDRAAYELAGLADADALALVAQDDGGNVDAALVAHEMAADIRIVMRLFDESLAESMRDLMADCTVLSATAVAAPSFVTATLGDDLPTAVHIADRVLYVTERTNTRAEDIVCALSITEEVDEPVVLPLSADRADLVLTAAVTSPPPDNPAVDPPVASGPVDAAAGRRRSGPDRARMIHRRARRRALLATTSLVGKRLRAVFTILVILLVAATGALVAVRHISWWQATYLAILTAFGGAEPSLTASRPEQVLQVALTVVSIALIPVATAAVVEAVVSARLALAGGGLAVPARDHYIVVGLGDVGTRVLVALDDAGEAVVGVDLDPNARGVAVARQRRVPVLVGDARREGTMQAAYAESATGLVVLTSSDVNNLETALYGRKLNPRLRTVLRLFDGDFAERVGRAFGFAESRSVSNLAAPSFAAAMLGREVIATIAVRRRVLLVAEFPVGTSSALEGASVAAITRAGEVRVIGIRTGRGTQTLWAPPLGRLLARTDRVIAVATRTGLGRLLGQSSPVDGPARIAVHDLTQPDLTTG